MAMAVILQPANALLAVPGSTAYRDAASAVAQATSCRDALRRLGLLALLDAEPPHVAQEAAAVFAAMPTAVDQAILGALRAGFARGASMKLVWEEVDASGGEPTVAHRVDEQDEWIYVYVIAPDGGEFLSS